MIFTTTRRAAYFLIVLLACAQGCAFFRGEPGGRGKGLLVPVRLRCEHLADPLGIDAAAPRLSWALETVYPEARGQRQTAYQVLMAGEPGRLDAGEADLWDSGRVTSKEQLGITAPGLALGSGQRRFWKVRVWDRDGRPSRWSRTACFETGLFSPDDWTGVWIDDGKAAPEKAEDFYRDDPAPLFRKAFSLEKPVRSARLYISGLGYYEAFINGKRVGDRLLDPGWTTYSERVLYSTYDVTPMLREGENVLGVMAGNGWYNPLPIRMWGRLNLREHLDPGRPRIMAQLSVVFTDGARTGLATDTTWKVGESPLLRNNVYLGEVYDARREQPGWDAPGFDDSGWRRASEAVKSLGPLRAQMQPPVRALKTVKAVGLTEPAPGVYIFDMGRNLAGWARLRVRGPAGKEVTLRFGELLHPDGTLNGMTAVCGQVKSPGKGGPGAPDVAFQEDRYILKGEGWETYTPRFAFHGFRYVEVTGYPGRPGPEAVEAVPLCADVESAGSFACSHELFNRIQQMVRRTFTSNLFSVQSDCPAREKFGYGGDMAATSEAFMFNFDMAAFYAKTVRDFGDAAGDKGVLTMTAPFVGIAYANLGGRSAPPGWAVAHPLLQEQLFRYYGCRSLLEEQYETGARWMELLEASGKEGILDRGLGDHESIAPVEVPVTGTSFYYQNARLMARLAELSGRKGDAARYGRLAEGIRAAFMKRFIDFGKDDVEDNAESEDALAKDGQGNAASARGEQDDDAIPGSGHGACRVGTATQACQAIALFFGLLQPEDREAALDVLVDDIEERGGHLSTGIFGTRYLLHVLTAAGRADLAYKVVDQRTFPGWGNMLEQDATTLWEHWRFSDNTFSHNHPMFGSVSEWFFRALGGINPAPDAVGFDRVHIRPRPVGGLTWARTRYDSVRGTVATDWRLKEGRFHLEVRIPPNTTATVRVPATDGDAVTEGGGPAARAEGVKLIQKTGDAVEYELEPGVYRFASTVDA